MKLRDILSSFFLILLFSGEILSHQKSQSYTIWKGELTQTDFEVNVITKIRKSILFNQLVSNGFEIDELEIYFKNKLSSKDCNAEKSYIDNQDEEYVRYVNSFVCKVEEPEFKFDLFFDLNVSHLDFSAQYIDGKKFPDFIITSDSQKVNLFDEKQETEFNLSFLNFLNFGFQHILSGLDHIAFLFLIIFLCRNVKTFFYAISGFTLGHSASLFMSVQGLILSSANLVELMIGFSILVCSVEILGKKTFQLKIFSNTFFLLWALLTFFVYLYQPNYVIFFASLGLMMFCYLRLSNNFQSDFNLIFITLIFGFIHGLGFAGAISEIFLPSDEMIKILVAFNLGIELGQIMIFAIFALIIYLLSFFNLNNVRNFSVIILTIGIFGYSTTLIVERSFLIF